MLNASEDGGRRHERVSHGSGTVMVRFSKLQPFINGALIDISISGCLVRITEPVVVNPEDIVELRINLLTLAFRALGYVRHANPATHAMGIEFHHISAQDKADLATLINYYADV